MRSGSLDPTRRSAWRIATGSVVWLLSCVALIGLSAVTPSRFAGVGALLVLGAIGAATYGLGFYAGSWWAMVVPTLVLLVVEVEILVAGGGDSGAAIVFWFATILFGVLVFLVKLGIDASHQTSKDA
jgi:hypothetical protein